MPRLNRDDIDKFHEYGLHVPTRTVSLETSPNDEGDELGVGYAMAQRAIKNLWILDHISDAPITVLINTGGGEEQQGMAIFDAIQACRSRVTGLVTCEASSMGSVILQACDERVGRPSSAVMYHSGAFNGSPGVPVREARAANVFEWALGDRIDAIVREKLVAKMTKKKFELMADKGIYLTAAEAVEVGLLDRVEE